MSSFRFTSRKGRGLSDGKTYSMDLRDNTWHGIFNGFWTCHGISLKPGCRVKQVFHAPRALSIPATIAGVEPCSVLCCLQKLSNKKGRPESRPFFVLLVSCQARILVGCCVAAAAQSLANGQLPLWLSLNLQSKKSPVSLSCQLALAGNFKLFSTRKAS